MLAACSADYPEGKLACDTADHCPSSWVCEDRDHGLRCYRHAVADADAGADTGADTGSPGLDSGPEDGGARDANVVDANVADADVLDATGVDAEQPDATDSMDASTADACTRGCAPHLTALTLSTGALSPAFEASVDDYSASVGLFTQTVELVATASTDATVTIGGTVVVSGAAWTSPVLNLGDNVFSVVVSASSQPTRTYTVTIARSAGAQDAYLKASYTFADDAFGSHVAISGDTIVVGVPLEDGGSTGVNGDETDRGEQESGAAYVFTRVGGIWMQQAYLKASNTDHDDNFGASVAIAGDTIAVGASGEKTDSTGVNGPQSNNSAPYSGAVFVFTRTASTWTQQAYLKASNTGLNDRFGHSISLSGDTLAVGAYGEGSTAVGVNSSGQLINTAPASGAVYVFVRSGSAWSQQAYLKASNTGAADAFGYSVAVSGDTVLVGAYGEDGASVGINGVQTTDTVAASGAAYVFTRSGTTWSQQAYLKSSNSGGGDFFGQKVALWGDTAVVASLNEDSVASGVDGNQVSEAAAESGAVYVFVRSANTWTQQAYLKASNTGAADRFGSSLAISFDTIVVGAPGEDSNATGIDGDAANNTLANSGAAYVFMRTGTTWSQRAYLKAGNSDADDAFGSSVAVSGDTIAVGGVSENSAATGVNKNALSNAAPNSGAVYVFR